MLAEAFRARGERMPLGGLAIIGLVGAAAASVLLWNRNATSFGVIAADNFSLFVNLVIIIVGIMTVVVLVADHRARQPAGGRVLRTLLFAIVGMMLMAQATDLLLIFLALETMSIAVYVLTGIRRESRAEHRGGLQVLPAGRLCQLVLPLRHRVPLRRHRHHQPRSRRLGDCGAVDGGNPMILLGVGLLLVGFAFKVAAVPFHMWSPDAYEGAPPWSPASCPRA